MQIHTASELQKCKQTTVDKGTVEKQLRAGNLSVACAPTFDMWSEVVSIA